MIPYLLSFVFRYILCEVVFPDHDKVLLTRNQVYHAVQNALILAYGDYGAAVHLKSLSGQSYSFPYRQEINGVFTPGARQRQGNDKTNVEPVHSYYPFHTRSDMSGVKGIIGMHRFNFCLVVVLSSNQFRPFC